jgi:predicted adenine nucleotide alpha hydrolase (AANH) superfamily ATPase
MKKVLMHTCCAPCSVYCIDSLRAEDIEPVIFWYNPNIHPYIEYKTRRDCLKDYAAKVGAEIIIKEEYGLIEHCAESLKDLENRCVKYCYVKRLTEAVRYAAEHGYDAFTTTLLVSPYQKHDELKALCEQLAAMSGIEFVYRDFRVGYREGQAKARELGLYMQKYCGCIFSEEDRYKKQILREQNQSEA